MNLQDKSLVTDNGRGSYFKEMALTWDNVSVYMKQKLAQLSPAGTSAADVIATNPLIRKRLSLESPKLRPFLLRMSFEASGGKDWERIIPACAAVEFVNISTYLTNAVFDEKGGEDVQRNSSHYIIAAMVLRDLASECLHDLSPNFSEAIALEAHSRLAEINRIIYFGQHIDLHMLKKDNINYFNSLADAKSLYLERAEKFCGNFMGNVAYLGAVLACADCKKAEALRKCGTSYGTGLQIINDLADFSYDEHALDFEKIYKDLYSDIRQGKLTYPVILALEDGQPSPIVAILGKKDASQDELREVTRCMVESGIVRRTKKLSKSMYNECIRALKQLPPSNARSMLSIMASTLRTNKYLTFFRSLEKKKN